VRVGGWGCCDYIQRDASTSDAAIWVRLVALRLMYRSDRDGNSLIGIGSWRPVLDVCRISLKCHLIKGLDDWPVLRIRTSAFIYPTGLPT
jgi:hypothetical protein